MKTEHQLTLLLKAMGFKKQSTMAGAFSHDIWHIKESPKPMCKGTVPTSFYSTKQKINKSLF